MIGLAGLVLAVVAIVFLVWRGWHMAIVSLAASLIVVATNGMDPLSSINVSYMGDMSAFVGSWFLLFALGSVFGRVMGDSGASAGIASSMLRLVGEKHALLVIMITGLVLSYGGISAFIIAFSVYPIAAELFQRADIPKKLIVAAIMVCPATLGMVMMPGIPSTQNLIPTSYLGTDAYAGGLLGVICSVVMFAMSYAYLQWEIGRCRHRGEHFSPSAGEKIGSADAAAETEAPATWACFAPIVLLVMLVFVLQRVASLTATDAVSVSMVAAVALACLLYKDRIDNLRRALGESCASGLNSLITVAAIMGFGGVVVASPAYQGIVEALMNTSMNPLWQAFITIFAIAGITGSAIGALNIYFSSAAGALLATGLDPAMIHRVLCMASVGPATLLPHTSAMLAANQAAHTEVRDTYRYVLVSCALMPVAVSLLGMALGLLGVA